MIFRTTPWKATLARRSPSSWSSGIRALSTPSLDRPVQSYISTSNDPYLNLSIEHHLLQKSTPDSAILFLYINRPSIIIGRNQNPWLEVNLALLNPASSPPTTTKPATTETPSTGLANVDLVRRRSGGGTVFHDSGNVNWTVISPSASFTRDKHAEMIVRALRSLGIARSRVNERHDVVLDQGPTPSSKTLDPEDTHTTPYQTDGIRPLKVSGSAYKLTRARALHHGTCLLNSPNLNIIPHYLHSPAKPFITARGVESVSSPVGNIGLSNSTFIAAVREQFGRMYLPNSDAPTSPVEEVGESWLSVENVKKGYDELKSPEWTYLQTPQFTCSSAAAAGVSRIELTVRYGAITEARVEVSGRDVGESLVGRRLHEIDDWGAALQKPEVCRTAEWDGAVAWLGKVFGRT